MKSNAPVVVKVDRSDNTVGRVNANRHRSARGLLNRESLNVDNVLGSVDLDDLALATLVLSTGHLDLVVLPDGKSSDLTNPNITQTQARTITHRRVSLSGWSIRR